MEMFDECSFLLQLEKITASKFPVKNYDIFSMALEKHLYDVNFSNWTQRWWIAWACFRTVYLIWRWTGLMGIDTTHMKFLRCSNAWNVHHSSLAVYMLPYHALVPNICVRFRSHGEKEPNKNYNEKLAITIIMPFTCMASQNGTQAREIPSKCAMMKANHVNDTPKLCTFIETINIQMGLCDVYQQRIDFMRWFK